MNTEAYLNRIGYSGSREPTLATLKVLQRAHLLHVPFENLDIHQRQEIRIDVERFYDKIVGHKRGGFCFEVNGLFNELLKNLGFSTHFITCSVFFQPKQQFTPYFGHVAIVVHLEEPWLVDVGFGTNFPEPLRLSAEDHQHQDDTYYQLVKLNEVETLLRRTTDQQEYIKMYKFKPEPHLLTDFAGMCRYHQTSPESPFTQGKLCSLLTPDGRITLTDKNFIETIDGKKNETPVENYRDFDQKLKKYFGIAL
ncbi:arylamine N-acetyltransferase family protein [Tunicatimonas pelagia]|uniref:arylamine N-acetyltransferase family protein n=1 Tax=Tunicatimonas pelagia TaxID=931531 RepID=UPI002665749B|nr:arylamine N-acetyltransferase [Tunicatimonas pelagia]WKN45754.1 arylamine N-acetyltransferase [Tunicatimonas pelagia]